MAALPAAVARAQADGYTLLFTGTSALSVVPHMRQTQYTMDDFVPIGTLTGTWLYAGQTIWERVSFAKIGSWYLLLYVALVSVTLILRSALHAKPLSRSDLK